jgi:hypothetical protein
MRMPEMHKIVLYFGGKTTLQSMPGVQKLPSSRGNVQIRLAFIAAAKGSKLVLTLVIIAHLYYYFLITAEFTLMNRQHYKP